MVAGFGQLNYVASCRSSTTESASESHRLTFFTLPTARAVPLLCWVVVVCVCCLCLVLCFACAAGIFLILIADVSTMLNRSFGCAKKNGA